MTLTPLGSHLVADPLSVTPWSVVDKGGAVAWLDLAVWFIGISSSTLILLVVCKSAAGRQSMHLSIVAIFSQETN